MIHRLWRTVPYLIACVLGLLVLTHGRPMDRHLSPSYGCCTNQQILDRAVRLCHLLGSQTDHLRLSAEHTIDGDLVHVWTVEASNDGDIEILNLAWDATTGDLSRVSFTCQPSPKPNEGKGRPLTDREVARAAWGWMQTVGFDRQVSGWRLAGAPKLTGEVETVTWKAGDRVAVIRLDGWSGRLIMAQSWRHGGPGDRAL